MTRHTKDPTMLDQPDAETDASLAGLMDEVAHECLLYRSRMTARAVTRLYQDALRGTGLESPQFSLLVAIMRLGPDVGLSSLAERVGLDRTTLVRNIQALEAEGLVRGEGGGPGRAKRLFLTPAGEARLRMAYPKWRAAQSRLVKALEVSLGPDAVPLTRAGLKALGKGASALDIDT
jgi:DNA-binding MarR family transcriptional regulator